MQAHEIDATIAAVIGSLEHAMKQDGSPGLRDVPARQRRANDGLCATGCGQAVECRLRADGTPTPRECSECAKRTSARGQRRYWKLRKQKRCTQCAVPSGGAALCPRCTERYNQYQNSRYHSARSGNQCDDCGAPSKASRCGSCVEKRAASPARQWEYRAPMERAL